MIADGRTLSEVDYGDVAVAGAVSAAIPGAANALKAGYQGAKAASHSKKAVDALKRQSTKTANKAQKIKQRVEAHQRAIRQAGTEAAKATATAVVHQGVKGVGKEAAPPVTAETIKKRVEDRENDR